MNKLKLYTMLGIGLVSTLVQAKSKGDNKERPNILFILSDDHAIPAISAYNSTFAEVAPTPNLDEIAANGVLFNHMICTNSIS